MDILDEWIAWVSGHFDVMAQSLWVKEKERFSANARTLQGYK